MDNAAAEMFILGPIGLSFFVPAYICVLVCLFQYLPKIGMKGSTMRMSCESAALQVNTKMAGTPFR
jgi:hypothetical protein